MFIQRLLNQGNSPLIEQAVRFSAARQRLLAENVANVSTPGYRQKDLSVAKFQQEIRKRVDARRSAVPGTTSFHDIVGKPFEPEHGVLFHDGNNRSMEHLMADGAKNAMMHNMMIELLRKQMGSIENALRERVA